jgi:TnpA family transposase
MSLDWQNQIGKIERTIFMLDWLENPSRRRRSQAGLTKSAPRHALTQAICTFRQGRIIDRSHEAQRYRASGPIVIIAASCTGIRPTWRMQSLTCHPPAQPFRPS